MSTKTEQFRKRLEESIKKDPERFIQPTIHIDKLTRQEYVNPDFVSRYGNPFNTKNPKSIYLEKSENELGDEVANKKAERSDVIRDIKQIAVYKKYSTEYFTGIGAKYCRVCGQPNHPQCGLCFHCGTYLIKSR